MKSRYAWPGMGRKKKGRALERQAFLAERRGVVAPNQLMEALRGRRRQLAELMTATPLLAPGGDADLWVPIGPTTVLEGAGGGRPRVTGRVRDVQVSEDGQRAYAATANGGVWYSEDAGESWAPVGGWTVTPSSPPGTPPNITTLANVLVCGCLYVRFGNSASTDEVVVGTGELLPQQGYGAGVGVLRAVGPAAQHPFNQVWNLEGENLAGLGIARIVANPNQSPPSTFVAATSSGLWTRDTFPALKWTQVAGFPFGDAAGAKLICTDAVWVKGQGGTPSRLWVAVRDDAGTNSGLWVNAGGTTGGFTQVKLPGLQPQSRISLAAAPSNPGILYALAHGNLVWRIDDIVPTPVTQIPPNLLGVQAHYNQAIAVHPTRPERIVLGGQNEFADGQWSASLYLGNVTGPTAGSYRFAFTSPAGGPTVDDTYIGHGVHQDVHITRFVPVPGKSELWVGCDGGVFRSREGDADNRVVKNTFIARNNGIAALECGYVATHPMVDGYSMAGTTDNGTLERIGDTIWRVRFLGDGGGVVFNPAAPHRHIHQYIKAVWYDEGTASFTWPVWRTTSDPNLITATELAENNAAGFYSAPDAVFVPPSSPSAAATSRVALGTFRVWFSQDWGDHWVTLPSMTDPMARGAQNINVDPTVPGAGAGAGPNFVDSRVVTCRWASPHRLYALCHRAVLQYDLEPDAAAASGLKVTAQVLTRQKPRKWQTPQAAAAVVSPGEVLPAIGFWTDLYVHEPGRGAHGSFYVTTTSHPSSPTMDTVWWFDGVDRWHATGLKTDATNGVPAPAYAVVVDPNNTDVLYVGTAVGVWKGTFDAAGPSWTWQVFSNGLPEAAVLDLTILNQGSVRLLRAALQARGMWDVDLSAPGKAQTYVRVHAWDTRRAPTVSLVDPTTQPVTGPALSGHASPDIRVRPRRGSIPPAPRGLPWVGASADEYGLWVFQTALRARAAQPDPLVKPDGQWTPLFEGRLRAATGDNQVTATVWNTVVGSGNSFPNAYADPWNGGSPTEADLFELVRELRPAAGSPASMGLRPVAAKVDVLVHHRHQTPVLAADVKVTLLRLDVTAIPEANWNALPTNWREPVQTLLNTGGAVPALPDGWAFADTAQPVRSPASPVDARLPRAVTFDVDFTGLAKGKRFLLVAVVHSSVDPVALPDATLQPLVLGTRFVTLRSLEIV
jgi:hypothetical protein